MEVVEINRFIHRSLAHAAHLAYLEGAEQTHRFAVQLAAVVVYLSRSDSDVSLANELEVLPTLIAAINDAEDGARSVHLELDSAPAVGVSAEARVARGSILRVVIDLLYGGQISRDVRQLHLFGRYSENGGSFRFTCREADAAVDIRTRRNTA